MKYGVPDKFPALAGHLKAERVEYEYLNAKDFAIVFDVNGLGQGMKDLNGSAQFEMADGEILKIAGEVCASGTTFTTRCSRSPQPA